MTQITAMTMMMIMNILRDCFTSESRPHTDATFFLTAYHSMNSDPVLTYLRSFYNKMPPGYTFHVNKYKRYDFNDTPIGNAYHMRIANSAKNRNAAFLNLAVNTNKVELAKGATHRYNAKWGKNFKVGNNENNSPNFNTYRGKGFGEFLRAIATRAGAVAKKNYGEHVGVYAGKRNGRPPASTRIVQKLGWKPVSQNKYGHVSRFNYNQEAVTKLNNKIKELLKKWNVR